MKNRKLVLRSEPMAELMSDDMRRVVGGTHVGCPLTHATLQEECDIPSNPVYACVSLPRCHPPVNTAQLLSDLLCQ